jgi:SAM-dependent methyltransferase
VHACIRSGRVEINLGDFESVTDDDAMHPIKIGQADKLLAVLEILNVEGKIKNDKSRKYEQINHFIKLISNQLEKVSRKERITILDCGCGKSYLSFVLNYFLRERLGRQCYFFGLDTDVVLIEKCKEMQKALGYANMEFQVSKIMDFQPTTDIDIVCSLHACDTATDEAIALGITSEASLLMVVPCCQSEIINQLQTHPLKAITRHGVFDVKLADLLTDAIRVLILEANGYKVTVVEFVSPIYTPKNLMILAEKIQPRNLIALEQYRELVDMFHLSPALERYLHERIVLDNK